MEDEDFEAVRVEGYKTIEITDFVPYDEIDPIYFARTYYLGPGGGGEKVYSLLLRAMEHSGLAGIAKFVMRDRQNLGALRVRDGVIILEQMYFADEIRPLDEIKPRKAAVSKEELAMADQLIENFAAGFRAEEVQGHVPGCALRDHSRQASRQGGPSCSRGQRSGATRSARSPASEHRGGRRQRPYLPEARLGKRFAWGSVGIVESRAR